MTLRRIQTDAAPRAVGPYSQGMVVGSLLYTAGQIAIDPESNVFQGHLDAAGQARLALANLRAVIEAAGATTSDVIKTTVFLTSMADFGAVNEVYAEFFGEHAPARSAVAVAELPLGARFEVEAVAVVRSRGALE